MANPATNLPENPAENRTLGADVNDTGNITGKLKRRREQVEEADIPEVDREAILGFFRFRRAEGKARNTLITDLSTLRNASERAEVPITDMGQGDMQDLLARLVAPESEGGYGLTRGGGGIYNYKRALRVFFRWLDGRDEYGDFPFWESVETPTQEIETQPPEERLTWDDVQALKAAAARGRNGARDRALIGMLAEGHRVTAIAQLRVGDVNPFGDDPTFTLNDATEDGYKDMESVERTLLYCAADLRGWIGQAHPDNGHPDGPRPGAPLWPIQTYDLDRHTECALSNDGVESVLERAADRAGIDKPVNPHTFRHAFHTQLANDPDVDPRDQKHLGGWGDLRMIDHYDESTAGEKNHALRVGLGLTSDEPDGANTTPDPHPCWNCSVQLTTEDYCPSCGEPQSASVRIMRRKARSEVREGLPEDSDDPNKTMTRAEILDALDDAAFWELVEDRLGDV